MSVEISNQPKRSQWRQILIVLAASFVMTLACCGGGAALDGNKSQAIDSFAGFLLLVGSLSFLAFLVSLLVAFGKMLFDFFGGLWG